MVRHALGNIMLDLVPCLPALSAGQWLAAGFFVDQ
jgi:hypothetical protein